MKRNLSTSFFNKIAPAYKRITSDNNIKVLTLPKFLQEQNPLVIKIIEYSSKSLNLSPTKPKILEKYPKNLENSES